MELLAPAGNLEKLSYAYTYGADAAYIGVRSFSLRTRADNFHSDEYRELKRIKGSRKLYGALNIFFKNRDIRELEQSLEYLSCYPFDAFIISDIGILRILRKHFPDIPLHLSTQANCLNLEAAKMYRDLGFRRVIMGREASLSDIGEIKQKADDLEIEVFVHGAMCIAYSGRCLLSAYMTGRSANRGDCAHSCRWNYRVLEEQERPGEYYPVIQDKGFTAVLSSRDLCMIDHLRELRDAGIDSLKIEGRMKSLYYTAVVTRAYRKALDHMNDSSKWAPYREDLFRVSHREYSTGFFFGTEEMDIPAEGSYRREYLFIGTVGEELFPGRFAFTIKNQLRQGETIEFIGPDVPCIRDDAFTLFDETGAQALQADHGKVFTIAPSVQVKPGYIIRKPILES